MELKARESGILYAPQPDRYREGRPVYFFGNASIYIDRNVIFYYRPETQHWEPISLDYLMSVC